MYIYIYIYIYINTYKKSIHLRKTIDTCFERALIEESKNSYMDVLSYML